MIIRALRFEKRRLTQKCKQNEYSQGVVAKLSLFRALFIIPNKGPFTYYLITRGGKSLQMIMGGGRAIDYVIKLIFSRFY